MWALELARAEAEVAWLDGRVQDIGPTTDAAFEVASACESPWLFAELARWRHRAGIEIPRHHSCPEPGALELDGRPRDAAVAWERLSCPYEAAVALVLANGEIGQRLYVSPRTVDFHVSAVLRKMGAKTRGEAVAAARRRDVLESR